MLVTITNLTDRILGAPGGYNTNPDNDAILARSAVNAVGAARVEPLPYPFNDQELAANGDAGDDIQRAMHPEDFRRQHEWDSQSPRQEWNAITAAGTVSFAIASETGRTDVEELFMNAI